MDNKNWKVLWLMVSAKMNQRELAKRIGVSESYISKVIRGKATSSKIKARLCEVFQVASEEMFD